MKKNGWLFFTIFLLLSSNIITRIKFRTSTSRNNQFYTSLSKCDSLKRREVKDLLLKQLEFDLSSKIMLNSLLHNNEELASLLNGENRIIVYFDENVCKSCVLSIVMDLDILAEEIGHDKIILAGSFTDQESLNDFTKNFQSNISSIIVNDIKLEGYPSEGPHIFLVDPELNVKLFYSPETYPEINDIYFKEILKEYMIKNSIEDV